jgi:hypothetical protein
MGKRKNQALIDSDSSNDSTSDLDSVSDLVFVKNSNLYGEVSISSH